MAERLNDTNALTDKPLKQGMRGALSLGFWENFNDIKAMPVIDEAEKKEAKSSLKNAIDYLNKK